MGKRIGPNREVWGVCGCVCVSRGWREEAGRHRRTGGTHSITKLCEVNDFNNVRKAIWL